MGTRAPEGSTEWPAWVEGKAESLIDGAAQATAAAALLGLVRPAPPADVDVVVALTGHGPFVWTVRRSVETLDMWTSSIGGDELRLVAWGTAGSLLDGLAQASAAAEHLSLVAPPPGMSAQCPPPRHLWPTGALSPRVVRRGGQGVVSRWYRRVGSPRLLVSVDLGHQGPEGGIGKVSGGHLGPVGPLVLGGSCAVVAQWLPPSVVGAGRGGPTKQ